MGGFLLDDGDKAGDVIFGGGGGMDVDLCCQVYSGISGVRKPTLLLEKSSLTPLPDVEWAMVLYSSSSASLTS